MKKGLIFATTLAMALGVGVAVGAHRSEAKEVKAAETTTVYCKMTYSWWTTDGAAIGVHYWGGSSAGTSWPGVRMSAVATDEGVWKYSVPSDITGIIFTRVNGSGDIANWGAKTGDLALPTDGKNLYTITSSSAVWGDPGVTGEWSEYDEPAPDVPEEDGYYVVGTKSNWKFANATKMDAGQGTDKAQLIKYAGTAGEEFKVRSYLNGVEKWYGDSNYAVGESDKYLNIYINKDDGLWVEDWVEPDVPEEDGYYLISSLTNYKYAGATPMPQVDPSTGNVAVLVGYDPEPGEKIKARSYFSGEDKYSANVDGEKDYGETDSDLNFEFADTIGEDDTFDIYAYYDGDSFLFSVAPHAERVTVTVVAKQFAGSYYQGETSALYKDTDVIKGQPFTVPDVTPEGYVALGVYSDFNCTVPFESGVTPVESNMLLHIKAMQLGWYLAGGEDETFSVENSMKLSTSVGNKCTGAVEVPEGTTEENPFVVKPLEFVADAGSGTPGWAPATYVMGHEEEPAFVHIDEDTNFAFTVPGTYAFYVNDENKVWFNGGEYAYIEDFLSHTGTVCHTQGTQTDLDLLQLLWAQFEEGFNGLSEDEIKDIKDVGFNGGDEESDDAKLRMVARYAYIITKYGTAMFKDFIWGQKVEARQSSLTFSSSDVNNSTMIIVISIAAVSALAFTTLLVIKKRKSK